ncbi:hypothetical protein AXF42_Ash018477 [Apostasia shenzhenica]|uniref:Uncharacterized protein n=1 Tax=Apostasia shenzhenica TaxID=1088818 RepID=A0A2H9ZZD3_9ASPA|nr:hypothetical protein AXF42_Ash018477 [Apostasia shenzhenica]
MPRHLQRRPMESFVRGQDDCRKWARLPAAALHCPLTVHRRKQLHLHTTAAGKSQQRLLLLLRQPKGPPPNLLTGVSTALQPLSLHHPPQKRLRQPRLQSLAPTASPTSSKMTPAALPSRKCAEEENRAHPEKHGNHSTFPSLCCAISLPSWT